MRQLRQGIRNFGGPKSVLLEFDNLFHRKSDWGIYYGEVFIRITMMLLTGNI